MIDACSVRRGAVGFGALDAGFLGSAMRRAFFDFPGPMSTHLLRGASP
jgi:hypothetical protein